MPKKITFNNIKFLAVITWNLISVAVISQPIWSGDHENKVVSKYKIVKDLKLKSKYYYLPTEIVLAEDINGKPKFRLFSMKYIPQLTNNYSSKVKFLNILEMTVRFRVPSAEEIYEMKSSIPKGSTLESAKIEHIDIDLTIPSHFKPIEKIGSSALYETNKYIQTSEGEKTFSLKLDDFATQQIDAILHNNGLAISLHYKIWANGVNLNSQEITRSDESLNFKSNSFTKINNRYLSNQNLKSTDSSIDTAFLKRDTLIENSIVYSNSMAIRPDLNLWPDIREKREFIDILPARYSTLKIACYDFIHRSQPDLLAKKVTFKAISDNNQPLEPLEVEFNNDPNQAPIIEVRFPLPVNIHKPISYQTNEIFSTGSSQKPKSWKQIYITDDIVDISSTQQNSTLEFRSVDIELKYSDSLSSTISNTSVQIEYYLQKSKKIMIIPFNKPDYQSINIWVNKGTQMTIFPIWIQNGKKWYGREKKGLSDYFLLQI